MCSVPLVSSPWGLKISIFPDFRDLSLAPVPSPWIFRGPALPVLLTPPPSREPFSPRVPGFCPGPLFHLSCSITSRLCGLVFVFIMVFGFIISILCKSTRAPGFADCSGSE